MTEESRATLLEHPFPPLRKIKPGGLCVGVGVHTTRSGRSQVFCRFGLPCLFSEAAVLPLVPLCECTGGLGILPWRIESTLSGRPTLCARTLPRASGVWPGLFVLWSWALPSGLARPSLVCTSLSGVHMTLSHGVLPRIPYFCSGPTAPHFRPARVLPRLGVTSLLCWVSSFLPPATFRFSLTRLAWLSSFRSSASCPIPGPLFSASVLFLPRPFHPSFELLLSPSLLLSLCCPSTPP